MALSHSPVPTPADSRERLVCMHCGTHVLVRASLHQPGGECSVCHSYELLPLDQASPPFVPAAPLAIAGA
jgi:hypothetical protein